MRAGSLNTVHQTLTPEAASILDHAIAEACRRGHGQTTPLHVAATLLAAPASHLRQACIRSHPNSSHPLQCRALELCFSVALDRLPAAQGPGAGSEPPISNALMAALKRAQAHQRRGCPEQQQQPLLAVKVELEQLIVSILDDPSVSRVMREASFSSPAVKATIEQSISMANSHSPISLTSSAVGYRLGTTPSILGNMGRNHQQHFEGSNRNIDEVNSRPTRNPNPYLNPRLQGPLAGAESSNNRNEDTRKIIEILMKVKKRNPILVGEKEPEAVLKELEQRIEKGDTPEQLRDVKILHIEGDISSSCSGSKDKDHIAMKFKEVERVVESYISRGVILNVGDLRWLVEQPKAGSALGVSVSSSVQQVVEELGHLLTLYGGTGRIWFIGVATCETFLRFQVHHSLEKKWELQPVPIAAARPASGLFPRYIASSSMDPVIPLKAFPPMAPPSKKSAESNGSIQKMNCCSQCMANYEQEINLIEEEKASMLSASQQSTSSHQVPQALPSWLQNAKPDSGVKGADKLQAKEQELMCNQKVKDLQKKWNDKCRILHPHFHAFRLGQSHEMLRTSSEGISTNEKRQIECIGKSAIHDPNRSNKTYTMTLDTLWQTPSQSKRVTPISTQSNGTVVDRISKALATNGHAQIFQASFGGLSCEPSINLPGLSQVSAPSSSPVITDLALGRPSVLSSLSCSISSIQESNLVDMTHKERLKDLPDCQPSNFTLPWHIAPKVWTPFTDAHPLPSTKSFLDRKNTKDSGPYQHIDTDAFKQVFKGLEQKVGWQFEAVSVVANAVMQCRSRNGKRRGVGHRGDIWLLFLGPDRVGKRKMAAALSEHIFGSERELICLKLSSHDSIMSSSWNQGQHELGDYGVNFRGKTALDRIAEAVRQNPFCVLLLEDVDQTDSLIHRNLIQAMEKGRLSDSHGREVSVGKVIFVMTANSRMDSDQEISKQDVRFSEEKLAAACGWPMQLFVESARFEVLISKCKRVSVTHALLESEGKSDEPLIFGMGLGNKRKADCIKNEPLEKESSENMKKMMSKEPLVSLDLNLSVEENDVAELSVSQGPTEACQGSRDSSDLTVEQGLKCSSELFKDLSELVDERVVFKPFDFEGLADKIVDQISSKFFSIFGSEGLMEIDIRALEQILAFIWLTVDGMKLFENWIEQVLVCSLTEVSTSCTVSADTIVKLVADKDCLPGYTTPGLCLPSNISVNRRTKPCQNAGGI